MGGWSLLYDNPSEARFADILCLDERTADDIIRVAKKIPTSDSEDSVYTRFSRIRARIVGNDSVKFNRDGKLLSEEELNIEEQLGTSVQDLNRWNEISFTSPLFDKSKLTPSQREWFESVFGCGQWGAEAPLARVDDEATDAWGPDAPVVNPSQSGPQA